MSTRRDLLAGFGVAAGAAALPLSTEVYHVLTDPKVEFQFGPPGPDIERAISPRLAIEPLRPTLGQIQGPFYAWRSPRRRDIRDTYPGDTTLVLEGYVLDTSGRPLPGYVLDFWQTDETARYDNAGYRYRGHQFTDRQGRFELLTVAPRPYSAGGQWRTAHIHAKAQGPGTRMLTTQLYFPDLADLNAMDPIFDPSLVLAESGSSGSVRRLRFDFILAEAQA